MAFGDGEEVPMDVALANAERIVAAVDLPVTVDFEGGYAADPDEAARRMSRGSRQTGRDRLQFRGPDRRRRGAVRRSPSRRSGSRRCARASARPSSSTPAPTFSCKAKPDAHDAALADAAIERAIAYAEAGASGFFIPGLADLALVERIASAVPAPGQRDAPGPEGRAGGNGPAPGSPGSATGRSRSWRCRRGWSEQARGGAGLGSERLCGRLAAPART